MISRALGYGEGEDKLERDFPQLYHSSNSRHLWVDSEESRLVAHSGFYPTVMRLEGAALPVAAIGGVCTEDDYQGKGIASELVLKCAAEAAKEGAALAFLWSDKHEFYQKLGFHLTGRQWTLTLEPARAPALRERGEKLGLPASELRIVEGEIDEEFLVQSYAMLGEYQIGPARSGEEHALYLGRGSCRVITAWAGTQLAAYLVMGKGKDLQNYIHEWAGSEAALHHLVAQCLETFGHTLYLLSPQFMPEEVQWLYTLDEIGVPFRAEYLALVKLLDFEKVRKATLDYVRRIGLDPALLKLERAGEGYTVQWKEEKPLELSEADLLRLLFGPELPAHPELRAFLPMRLWYWGMDSV